MSNVATATVYAVTVANDFRSRAEVVVYCAYGDESRDDTKKRVYAVAGVFGNGDDWQDIAGPWKERLGGKIFHASDCEFGHNDFSGMPPGENRRLYRDLTQLVAKSKLCSHGVAVNVREFKECFPNEFEHAPYIWAFGDVVQSMSELAHVSMPSGSVDITFDTNNDIEYAANEIYHFMTHSVKVRHRIHLYDRVSFACRRTVGIQIADLIARETMKHMDKDLRPDPIPTRLSFKALNDSMRFAFIPLGKQDFERKKIPFRQSPVSSRANLAAYHKWLEDKNLRDCLVNQIEFLKEFPEMVDDASPDPAAS